MSVIFYQTGMGNIRRRVFEPLFSFMTTFAARPFASSICHREFSLCTVVVLVVNRSWCAEARRELGKMKDSPGTVRGSPVRLLTSVWLGMCRGGFLDVVALATSRSRVLT